MKYDTYNIVIGLSQMHKDLGDDLDNNKINNSEYHKISAIIRDALDKIYKL